MTEQKSDTAGAGQGRPDEAAAKAERKARRAAEKAAAKAERAERKAQKARLSKEEAERAERDAEDERHHRRTLRLFDTSVEVRTDQGERVWDVALERALIERMGCNNTGYIAEACPARDYNRFVLSERGENFFGCSTDITELPYFDVYRERARELLARHIANADFGCPLSVFDRGYERRLRDRPADLAEIEARAEERVEKIVAEARRDWAASCDAFRGRYGDVYEAVFGPDAPRPAPHDPDGAEAEG